MSHPHPTGFMVLHSNQLEGLRELAVRFIRDNPLPPLAPEVLLVQSRILQLQQQTYLETRFLVSQSLQQYLLLQQH